MSATVRLSFGPTEVIAHVPEGAAWSVEQARRWLDEQFTAHECEPLRPLGKVLTRDKLIVLAEAIGAAAFEADAALRGDYAAAASALLAREQVHIDVQARRVTF